MTTANNHEDPPSYNDEPYAKFTSTESKDSEMQLIDDSYGGGEKRSDYHPDLPPTITNTPSSPPKPKALQLELQLCLANGVCRPGSLRSGKILRTFRDAILFDPNTTYDQLRNFAVARARHRGILKPQEPGEIQACALLVRPDGKVGSSTYFDATSWEAGRELVLGGRGEATLLFVCAVVDAGYESRELKKMEKKRKSEGRACVVM